MGVYSMRCLHFILCSTFSKRADVIDVLNIFSLITFSLFSIYFIKPSMLGFGLFQFLDSEVSGAVMFLVALSSLVLFLWGSFRGKFVEKVQSLFLQVKNFNFEIKIIRLLHYLN
jgi:hypothetical protein